MINKQFPWLQNPLIKILIKALSYPQHQFYFVGGCVRDSLLGLQPQDFDIVSNFSAAENTKILTQRGIKVIATGFEHGTITVVIDSFPFQITTMRRDILHDGRWAKVEFTNNLEEDAQRRDFTFNALYLNPLSGEVIDFFNAQTDLENGEVKFIGDIRQRIKEDYLRILRFFRFYCLFSKGEADIHLLGIMAEEACNLKKLSKERISNEILKIISYNNCFVTLEIMQKFGILKNIDLQLSSSEDAFLKLQSYEDTFKLNNVGNSSIACHKVLNSEILSSKIYNPKILILRLCLLFVGKVENIILRKKDYLLFKNISTLQRAIEILAPIESSEVYIFLSQSEPEVVIDALLLCSSKNMNLEPHYLNLIHKIIAKSKIPFPISGADIKNLGIAEGEEIGKIMTYLKSLYWGVDVSLVGELGSGVKIQKNNKRVDIKEGDIKRLGKDFYLQKAKEYISLRDIKIK